ncbi:MAG: two-CW domain-containing protein [Candidatus Omnitrophota bacterium]
MKKNCWEFKKCGREPGGENAGKLGVCPAAVCLKANKIHNGKNGGRCCWSIVGTLCGGKIQGTFVKKYQSCMECVFFALVTQEEDDILTSLEINKKIKNTE